MLVLVILVFLAYALPYNVPSFGACINACTYVYLEIAALFCCKNFKAAQEHYFLSQL